MASLRLLYQIPLLISRLSIQVIKIWPTRDSLRPVRRRISVALLQIFDQTFTAQQTKGLNPPTRQGVEQFCKNFKLGPPSSITIPIKESNENTPETVLHVIDTGLTDDKAVDQRIVLYLHGGGYAYSPSPVGQLPLLLDVHKSMPCRFLAVLEYGLAPDFKYPTQLKQAAAALQLICGDAGARRALSPTPINSSAQDLLKLTPNLDIILLGDSAGGHLILSLLAHIKTPNPAVPEIRLAQPIKATLLLSPWVTIDYEAQSYTYNASRDYLNRRKMLYFNDAWEPAQGQVWADSLRSAPTPTFWAEIFQGPDRMVEQTLLTVGTDEVFFDNIASMAELMDCHKEQGNVQFVRCAGEAHVGAVVDIVVGVSGGQMRNSIATFLTDTLY